MRDDEIAAALETAGSGVLILVTQSLGSTPRDVGTAMLVTREGLHGTVGGGQVEHEAIGLARSMLAGTAPEKNTRSFALGPGIDQCCGGRMTLSLIRLGRLDAARLRAGGPVALWPGGPVWHGEAEARPVIVYGAGHVGAALVRALSPLPFSLRWVDARIGVAPPIEAVPCIETPLPEAEAAQAPPEAMHIVMTHSHAIDLEIVASALAHDAAFVGLIGSKTKRATFRRKLQARGLDAATVARLACPIGLPGLRDKRPAVIAASVAAQLVVVAAGLADDRRGAA